MFRCNRHPWCGFLLCFLLCCFSVSLCCCRRCYRCRRCCGSCGRISLDARLLLVPVPHSRIARHVWKTVHWSPTQTRFVFLLNLSTPSLWSGERRKWGWIIIGILSFCYVWFNEMVTNLVPYHLRRTGTTVLGLTAIPKLRKTFGIRRGERWYCGSSSE